VKKYLLRWPTWLILAAIIVTALIPGLTHLYAGRPSAAHASSTSISPTLTPSTSIFRAYRSIAVAAQGFSPNETVEVYVDVINIFPMGFLPCDGNGNCSGTVSVSEGGTQGSHTLIGVGSNSGLRAQAAVTFIAGIRLIPPSGGVGTPIELAGSSFALNETVKIYWGTSQGILLGTVTSGQLIGTFYFQFTPPAGLVTDYYQVTVVRSHQTPASVIAWFHFYSPQVTSTPGIHSGQPVSVNLKGFQSNEQVTISWNANGGQMLASTLMNASGAGISSFIPPVALPGSYILTAKGNSSGLQATSSLNIGPGIQLTSTNINPGGSITVTGGGFIAGEIVQVYCQHTSNGIVSTTTDSLGTFQVSLTLPITLSPTGAHYIYATNTTLTDYAQVKFNYTGPVVSLNNSDGTYYGEQDSIYGGGFASNETVKLFWEYGQPGQVELATVTADSNGAFIYKMNLPGEPDLSSVNIAGKGTSSKLIAISTFYPGGPNIYLQPSSGPTGTTVNVNGGWFDSSETITLTFLGNTVATATTDSTGTFNVTFVVPMSLSPASYEVTAKGSTSGLVGGAAFTVTPVLTINPSTGSSGTSITVKGKSFSPSKNLTVWWYNPVNGTSIQIGTVTTNLSGAFQTTVSAPTGLTSGNTYYIQVFGDYVTPQIAFVAS
jgi:hypothetical protein